MLETVFEPVFAVQAKRCLVRLIKENPTESRDLKRHTYAVIYPMVAAVQVKMGEGLSRTDAIDAVRREYNAQFVAPNVSRLQTLLRIPFSYTLFIPVAKLAMRTLYSEKAGFKNEVIASSPKRYEYHVHKCPYQEVCSRYGLDGMVNMFCTTDDLMYRTAHRKVRFERTQTLGRGADVCDFCFYVKNESRNDSS